MSVPGIELGALGELEQLVTEDLTARHVGSGRLRVYATPAMVALVERACVKLIDPHLPEGKVTVGVRMSIRHLAPTPLGMKVRAHVEVIGIEDQMVTLRAEVWDESEKVGEAEHQRAIIDVERFLKRVRERADG